MTSPAPDIAPTTQGRPEPAADVPVIPVAFLVAGAYLVWFGLHYWGSDTKWPTDPLKAVLTGQPIPTPDTSARKAALTSLQEASRGAVGAAAGSAAAAGAAAAAGVASGASAAGSGSYASHASRMALWTANGGSPATANLAAAISMAEDTSGDPGATSPNPDGGVNVGLWQLDTKGEGSGYTIAQLSDPNTNARITVMRTANGSNWNAWETWHTGAYRKFLT